MFFSLMPPMSQAPSLRPTCHNQLTPSLQSQNSSGVSVRYGRQKIGKCDTALASHAGGGSGIADGGHQVKLSDRPHVGLAPVPIASEAQGEATSEILPNPNYPE